MPQESLPENFDWVAAQAKCSAAAMFERLQADVTEDVRRRNELDGRDQDWTFEVTETDGGFEVARMVPSAFAGSKVAALVRFEREGRRIHIQGDGVEVDFTAVVTLDQSGACRFVIGEAVYSEWEIRKMALEELFFQEEEAPEE